MRAAEGIGPQHASPASGCRLMDLFSLGDTQGSPLRPVMGRLIRAIRQGVPCLEQTAGGGYRLVGILASMSRHERPARKNAPVIAMASGKRGKLYASLARYPGMAYLSVRLIPRRLISGKRPHSQCPAGLYDQPAHRGPGDGCVFCRFRDLLYACDCPCRQ